MHKKPNKRGCWDPHSIAGWNIGTSMENHRIFNPYAKPTGAQKVWDIAFSKHKYLTQPAVSPDDVIVAAAHQLTAVLKGNAKGNNKDLEALTKLADLCNEIAKDEAEIAKKNYWK